MPTRRAAGRGGAAGGKLLTAAASVAAAALALAATQGQAFVLAAQPMSSSRRVGPSFGGALPSLGRVRGGAKRGSDDSTTSTRLFFKPPQEQRGGADATEAKPRQSPPQGQEEQEEQLASFQPPLPLAWGGSSGNAEEQPVAVASEGPLGVTTVEDSEPLTLTSAIALVAGTTVGAGILALPGT